MKKRTHYIQLLVLILITIIILTTTLLLFIEPKDPIVTNFDHYNTLKVDYLNIKEHIGSSKKAYFFCSESNADCIYTDTEIIPALINSANTNRFDQIYYVDITDINENILPSALKKHLGFAQYPAFALLSYENNKIIIHSVYEWKEDSIFSAVGIKQWMVENELWKIEYTN